MFPCKNDKFLNDIYEHAISVPYGCLFIDLRSETDDKLRFRSDLFDKNIVYLREQV